MKILFVARARNYTLAKDGGYAVDRRNVALLRQVSDKLEEFIIPMPTTCTQIRNILFRESYGNTPALSQQMRQLLKGTYDLVFFNGPLLGGYLKMFSKHGFRTCCFYHNVEYRYFQEKYKVSGSLRDRLIIPYIKYLETLSTMNADFRITLNERDSRELNNIYGKKADFILPTSFKPIDPNLLHSMSQSRCTPYILFVGSNFFANVEGLSFLIQEVAPRIKYDIRVVGSVCEAFRNSLLPINVKLEGMVDDLLPYYVDALCVVTPIFSGSGLKTKTVEALRYAKTVIGTVESFEGIPIKQYPGIGKLCVTAKDFIDSINCCLGNDMFNKESLSVFNKMYSDHAQIIRFQKFLEQMT